jgi:hypothetical protein
MTTEWLKIMLEEIARKKAEAEQAEDERRRRGEQSATPGTQDAARAEDTETGSKG